MHGLEVRCVPFGELVDVFVVGELDLGTAKEFQNQVTDGATDGHRVMMIDLSELTFIDASGVQALVDAIKANRAKGLKVQVINLNPAVYRVLETMKATDWFRGVHEMRLTVLLPY